MVCLQLNLFSQQRFFENISITNSYRKRNIFKVWKIVETFSGLCFALHILYLLQYIWWWCLSSRAEQNMKQQQRKTQKEMAHVCVNQSEHSLATDPNQWESSSLECRTLNRSSNLAGLIHHSPLKQQNYLNHTGAFLVLKYFVSRTPIFSPRYQFFPSLNQSQNLWYLNKLAEHEDWRYRWWFDLSAESLSFQNTEHIALSYIERVLCREKSAAE